MIRARASLFWSPAFDHQTASPANCEIWNVRPHFFIIMERISSTSSLLAT